MTNDYMRPEILEMGEAEELILGTKFVPEMDEGTESGLPDGELDD